MKNVLGTTLRVLDWHGETLVAHALELAQGQMSDIACETADEWRSAMILASKLVLLELARQIKAGEWATYEIRTLEDMGMATSVRAWLKGPGGADVLAGVPDDTAIELGGCSVQVTVLLPAFVSAPIAACDLN